MFTPDNILALWDDLVKLVIGDGTPDILEAISDMDVAASAAFSTNSWPGATFPQTSMARSLLVRLSNSL